MIYDELKSRLVGDLKPSRPSPSKSKLIGLWSLITYLTSGVLIYWSGPLRKGWHLDLSQSPRFLIEFLLGLALSPLCIAVVVYLNRPTESHFRRTRSIAPLLLSVIVMANFIAGIFWPIFSSSDLGYRPHCLTQTVIFSVPPLVLWLFLSRSGFTVRPFVSGIFLGIAAASPTAMAMHIACKYDPMHMLIYHFGPVAFISVLTGIAFRVIK